jgi:F-type H+-transporting ATPase subunit epsilon
MEETMAKKFQLEIIASDHSFYKGECESLVFPGIDGEHGILADHEAMVTCVMAGELRFKTEDGWQSAAISNGFVETIGTKVILLADTIERPEEIDVNRAKEAKIRAEEKLRQQQSIKEYYYTKAALTRAMNRLKISNKHTIN